MARSGFYRLTVASLAAFAAMTSPSRAGDSALQAACFAKDALAGREGERTPVRGNHKFDRDPLTRATLAAFTPVAAPLRGAIRRVDLPKGEKLIALTFDLCEQYGEVSGYDGGIFDYLRAENVAATLFAGGKWMRSHPERTQQLMTDPLFEMANHSEAHRNLRLLDATAMQNEILGPQRAYEAQRSQLPEMQCTRAHEAALSSVPTRLAMFRFPYGACNAASLNAVNDAGLLAIQWDLSSGDPDPRISVAALADGMLKRVKSGSIIVMHANGRGWNTAAALPIVIPKLKALGYQFVTVSELIARGKPVIADSCYDSKPGDTDRYDFPVSLTGSSKPHVAPGAVAGSKAWKDATTMTEKKDTRATAKGLKASARKTQQSKARRSS